MKKWLNLTVSLFFLSVNAHAVDPFDVFQQKSPVGCIDRDILKAELGLPELIEIGMCQNPKLSRGYMEVKSNEASVGKEKSSYLPSVSLSGELMNSYNKVEGKNSLNDDPYALNAAVSWLVYDFGGRSSRVKRAENYLLSTQFSYNALIKDTVLDINSAYFDLLSAQEVLKSAKTSEASFKKSYEESSRRYELGLVSLSDKLLAKTSYEQSRLEVVLAANQVKTNQGKLAELLNISPTIELKLLKPKNDKDLTKLAIEGMSIDEMIEMALSLRPEIQKMQKDIDAAIENINVQKAAAMPSVSLGASAGYNDNWKEHNLAGYSNSIGLKLSVPLFTGFSDTYKIKEASYQKEQADDLKKEMIDLVKNEVWTAYHNYNAAVSSYEISQKALESAVENERVAFASYQVGKGDILNLLTAGSQLSNARKEVIVAYYSVLTSKAKLYRAIGRF